MKWGEVVPIGLTLLCLGFFLVLISSPFYGRAGNAVSRAGFAAIVAGMSLILALVVIAAWTCRALPTTPCAAQPVEKP